MALLKKIRSSTVLETVIASAIVLVVFTVSSLTLNNIFLGTVRTADNGLRNRLREVEYLCLHAQLGLPYFERAERWEISAEKQGNILLIESLHLPSGKRETDKTVLTDEKD